MDAEMADAEAAAAAAAPSDAENMDANASAQQPEGEQGLGWGSGVSTGGMWQRGGVGLQAGSAGHCAPASAAFPQQLSRFLSAAAPP